MKNVRVIFEDHEFEKLVNLKGNKSWREFILNLVDYYLESQKRTNQLPKGVLKEPYKFQARALSEIGKLMIEEEEGYRYNDEPYLASLLPLLVIGEKIEEGDLSEFYVFITNFLFSYLREKYKDVDKMQSLFEYLRVAIIRDLKGDAEASKRFFREFCNMLREFS